MAVFKDIADDATLEWLLEESNPSVRYFTLKDVLNKSDRDADVMAARAGILKTGAVAAILGKQNKEGFWGDPKRFYLDKYKGSVWQLILLAELGCPPGGEKINSACEFILNNSQDTESFGFAVNKSGSREGGRHSEVIPCLTGNMVWSLIKLGYLKDERIQRAVNWICNYQRCDDGIEKAPSGWPYDRFEVCWGRHTCHMGAVKALKALSAVPEDERGKDVNRKIADLVEYVLRHHIYKKSHNLDKAAKPGWLRLGFPLMYQTDVLEILEILTSLKVRDSRMDDALNILRRKQTVQKRWKLENTLNGKMLADIEEKGSESKWITLKALYVLSNN